MSTLPSSPAAPRFLDQVRQAPLDEVARAAEILYRFALQG